MKVLPSHYFFLLFILHFFFNIYFLWTGVGVGAACNEGGQICGSNAFVRGGELLEWCEMCTLLMCIHSANRLHDAVVC
jgi:hypothetical protein